MKNRIIYIDNAFEPEQRQLVECDDVCAALTTRWEKLPSNVAIYHDSYDIDRCVTPSTPEGVEHFQTLQGDFYVVSFPGDATTAAYIIVALVVAVVTYSITPGIPTQAIPTSKSPPSPNNDLSERQNSIRVNGRIPDIYGTVISTPDLLAATYSIYIGHQEYENAYMCIGRGTYDIADVKDDTTLVSQIDGASVEVYGPGVSPNNGSPYLTIGDPIDTDVLSVRRTSAVNGQTLEAPNADNYPQAVQYLYPDQIVAPPGSGVDYTTNFTVGQTLVLFSPGATGNVIDPFSQTIYYETDAGTLTFASDGSVSGLLTFFANGAEPPDATVATDRMVRLTMSTQDVSGTPINLSGVYLVQSDDGSGNVVFRDVDLFNTNWALLPGGTHVLNVATPISFYTLIPGQELDLFRLDGSYEITAVTADAITLDAPGLVNSLWSLTYANGDTAPTIPSPGSTVMASLTLSGVAPSYIGPFDVFLQDIDSCILNFTAENGMYKDDGTTQTATTVTIEIETTMLSANGVPISSPRVETVLLQGSAVTTARRAVTYKPSFSVYGASGVRISCRRITPRDIGFTGTVVDAVQWKDFYGTSSRTPEEFGNVTTVQSLSRATAGALSLKSRKLNMRVTRRIPVLTATSPGVYALSAPAPTNDAASIFCAVALDSKLGGRSESELDFYNIRTTVDAVKAYFTKEACGEFCYTFTDDNTSAEEMLATIADAVFCSAYRQGSVIALFFEKENDESSLIFNHRNKVPRSEKRSTVFGPDKTYDGVEYTYIDPVDGSSATLYFPPDRSAVSPRKPDSLGVQNYYQAVLHGWRIYNRMLFKRTSVEFRATHEAELLKRNDRILVANNTKQKSQDGDIKAKNGLVLTTSQPVYFADDTEYSVALQLNDGTVQLIVATEGADEYSIVLTEEPSQELSLNPANFSLTKYMLVEDTKKDASAFLVDERTYDSPYISQVTAINYDVRYYKNDKDYSQRLFTFMEDADEELYDDASDEEKEDGGYFCEDNGKIGTSDTDEGYIFCEDDEL